MNKLSLCVILTVAALILAGCGGGGPSTTINVTFTDFQFTPNSYIIPAGQEITLNATNNGAVVHEFVIMKFGTTVGDDFGNEDEANIYWEIEVDPGSSKSVTFTAPPDAGEYQVVCGTPGHYMAGMVASLTVVAP
jgi:uncharacterized cupredoxin-like copper-binding protein